MRDSESTLSDEVIDKVLAAYRDAWEAQGHLPPPSKEAVEAFRKRSRIAMRAALAEFARVKQ